MYTQMDGCYGCSEAHAGLLLEAVSCVTLCFMFTPTLPYNAMLQLHTLKVITSPNAQVKLQS